MRARSNNYNQPQRHAIVMALVHYALGLDCITYDNSACPCATCGETSYVTSDRSDPNALQIGHIVSRDNGGSDYLGNLIPQCSACNNAAGNENLVEYVSPKWFNANALEALRMTEGQARQHLAATRGNPLIDAIPGKVAKWKKGGH